MPQNEGSSFAAHILPYAPGPMSVDTLLTAAGSPVPPDGELAIGPSAAAARAAARNADLAFLMARSAASSPQVLDLLARQGRVTVRRAVAANPSTGIGTLERLADWALAKDDDGTIDALLATLPPSQYVPRMQDRRKTDDDGSAYSAYTDDALKTDLVVANLARRANPAETWATFRIAPICLRRAIVAAAAGGQLPASAEDLISSVPETDRLPLLMAVLKRMDVELGDRVCDLLIEQLTPWAKARAAAASTGRETPDSEMPGNYRALLTYARRMTSYCASRFLDSGIPELLEGLCQSCFYEENGLAQLTEAQVDALARQANAAAANAALVRGLDVLTASQVEILARKCDLVGTAEKVLEKFGAVLSDDAVVAVIRAGRESVTLKWCFGVLPCRPTLDMIRQLVKEPGMSLGMSADVHRKAVPETASEYIERVIKLPCHLPNEALRQDALDDLMNWAGPVTLKAARSGGWSGTNIAMDDRPLNAARYIAKRLTERFGDNPAPWQVAVETSNLLTAGTVDDWLNLVAGLIC